MELNEAVHRIVLRHLKLVVGCLTAGLVLGFAATAGSPPLYSATARLVLEAPAPKSGAESAALANSGRAIATSYTHVTAALKAIGVDRNPSLLASRRITVDSVGSSDVLQLTVRDDDPNVASALANALAADIIATRRTVAEGDIPVAVTKLDTRIAELSVALTAVDAQIDAANVAIANSRDPQTLAAATATANSERSRRETVSQQLLAVQAERSRLIGTEAQTVRGAVVDPAKTPAHRDPSPVVANTALGALAGLTLGLGLAALFEAVRPSVVGRRSLSLAFNAPVLGQLTCCPADLDDFDVRSVQTTLRLAANAAGVRGAQLVAVEARDDLEPLGTLLQATTWREREPAEVLAISGPDGWDRPSSRELQVARMPGRPSHPFAPLLLPAATEPARALPTWPSSAAPHSGSPSSVRYGDAGGNGSRNGHAESGRTAFRIEAFDATSADSALEGQHCGFVVVVPEVGRRADLEMVADLISVSRRPLLGIITYSKRRDCSSRRRGTRHASKRTTPGGANE